MMVNKLVIPFSFGMHCCAVCPYAAAQTDEKSDKSGSRETVREEVRAGIELGGEMEIVGHIYQGRTRHPDTWQRTRRKMLGTVNDSNDRGL